MSSRQLNVVVLDFGGTSGLAMQIWEQLTYKSVIYSLRCGLDFLGNLIRAQDSSSRKKKCTHLQNFVYSFRWLQNLLLIWCLVNFRTLDVWVVIVTMIMVGNT